MIESGIEYQALGFLSMGVYYEYIINPGENKETEYQHCFAFEVNQERKIYQFKPSIRIRFTNCTDDQLNEQFLRYIFDYYLNEYRK